jgi:response regulator RpfG family c-di-GMP phosphodiesterase
MSSLKKKHKILVVEDNKSLLKMFKYFLINEFLEVVTAKNGNDAIEILKSNQNISVIISDYKMPEMNGIDFFKQAKALAPLATRILMSAYRDEKIIEEAFKVGEVFKFLNKPIDFTTFRICVDSAIERYEENLKLENRSKIKDDSLNKLLNCIKASDLKINNTPKKILKNDFGNISVNLFEMALSLSNALDLIFPTLYNHHKQVCYISTVIAEELDLCTEEYRNIFLASILHDIGAVSLTEDLDIAEFDTQHCHAHGIHGSRFFEIFTPLKSSANLIKHHHVNWDNGNGNVFKSEIVPIGSHIIHLADRVSVLIKSGTPVFGQVPLLVSKIKECVGGRFHPKVSEAFFKVSEKESFWLDITSPFLENVLKEKFKNQIIELDIEGLLEFSKFYSSIIDSRSKFTSNHSCGVAISGEILATKLELPERDCLKIKVAGYLHDLGKLVVPKHILEKPGKLSEEEWNIVKTHTYYTYSIIKNVHGLEEIAEIASFHHETLNGTGYPFHHNSDFLSIGARIIAVSDVYTALAEDRPYRSGMPKAEIETVLKNMVRTQKLDGTLVNILLTHYDEIDILRRCAQEEHLESLKDFF